MKKSAFAAVVLAAAIMLSGCTQESETKKTKKSKKSTKSKETQETIDTEDDPTGTSEEPSDTTSEVGSDPSDSAPTSAPADTTNDTTAADPSDTGATSAPTPTTQGSIPDPTFDFAEDPYGLYEDASFQLPSVIFAYLFEDDGAGTSLMFDPGDGSIIGDYEKPDYNSVVEPIEFEQCSFTASFDGFTRVNGYSFSTHVNNLKKEPFEPYEEEKYGVKRHVTFVENFGFDDPGELVLFLPNTPMDQIPTEILPAVKDLVFVPDSEFLQMMVIYDVNDQLCFLVAESVLPETDKPTMDDMEHWLGHYVDSMNGADFTIRMEDSTGEFLMDGVFDGKVEIKDAVIRVSKYDRTTLFIFCENSDGYVIFEIDIGDALIVMSTVCSTIAIKESSMFYYPEKQS
ncbi:MAG: hypothetical protein J5379_00055 [Clostridiales bacterium]|nr:hypothetical protein [Clostridiales bacterium]